MLIGLVGSAVKHGLNWTPSSRQKNFNNRKVVGLVIMDQSAAFNVLEPDIPVPKLRLLAYMKQLAKFFMIISLHSTKASGIGIRGKKTFLHQHSVL